MDLFFFFVGAGRSFCACCCFHDWPPRALPLRRFFFFPFFFRAMVTAGSARTSSPPCVCVLTFWLLSRRMVASESVLLHPRRVLVYTLPSPSAPWLDAELVVTRATRTTFQRKRFGPPPEESRGVRGRASESVPLHPRRVLAKTPSQPAPPALLPPCVGARFLLRALCREVVAPSARAADRRGRPRTEAED